MINCNNCNAPVNDNAAFCPSCGKKIEHNNDNQASTNQTKANFSGENFNEKLKNLNDTPDYTNDFDSADIQANKGLSILAYIYILFLVPLLGAPHSKFARFHTNQGLILFLANIVFNIPLAIIIMIIESIPFIGRISFVFNILRIVPLIFMILGIINAANGKAKELPFIGKFKILN